MRPSYISLLSLLLLASPLSVLAQNRRSRSQGAGSSRSSTSPRASSSTPPLSATEVETTATSIEATDTATKPANTASTATLSGTKTNTATGTTPSSTGGGSCSGSGLEIQWTGDEVSYSWSGGSGTTSGCLSLGSDWSGQVAVGGSGGTIFEGNSEGYFDVSYILGYSVPMLCSANGAKSGCSKDLLGNGGKPGTVHKNPTGPGGAHDPGSYNGCPTCTPWCYACSAIDSFFAPCAGSAYTYPYDDGATVGPATGPITCCIGTSCGSTGREGATADGNPELSRDPPCDLCAGGSKRTVDELETVFKRSEEEIPARSPSLLARRNKIHGHHAGVHGAAGKIMS